MNSIIKKEQNSSESNSILNMISSIMSNTTFREIFDEHFNSWDDIKAILMIMKVYQLIEFKCKQSGITPTNDDIVFAIKTSMNDSSLRSIIREDMTNFINIDKDFKNGKLEQIINITIDDVKKYQISNNEDKMLKDK